MLTLDPFADLGVEKPRTTEDLVSLLASAMADPPAKQDLGGPANDQTRAMCDVFDMVRRQLRVVTLQVAHDAELNPLWVAALFAGVLGREQLPPEPLTRIASKIVACCGGDSRLVESYYQRLADAAARLDIDIYRQGPVSEPTLVSV